MSLIQHVEAIRAGLAALATQMPDVPQSQVLIKRLLVQLGRELAAQFEQRLKPYGLSELEYRSLLNVYMKSQQSQVCHPGMLCGVMGQSPANITRLTDVLVERQLVVRRPDEQDRRRLGLFITAKGQETMESLLPVMMDTSRQQFAAFSAAELDSLLQLLTKLAVSLDHEVATQAHSSAHLSSESLVIGRPS